MARLAYCRDGQTFSFSEDVIRSVLNRVGFKDCLFIEGSNSAEEGGTHCFLALNQTVNCPERFAVLCFRGTDADDPTDLGDDADGLLIPWVKNVQVHNGFARALTEVLPQLESALESINCPVLYTGHSLGAALATLLAAIRPPTSLYTFGAPRVGDANFVATLDSVDCNRYVNCCDLVTEVPPAILGYVHPGKPYYFNRDGRLIVDPERELVFADQINARKEYLLQYAWKSGNLAVRDLADHAPINYVYAASEAAL